MGNQWTKPVPLHNQCHNCGIVDDLQYFEFVYGGITLCQDCADLPYNAVCKQNVNWVSVDGELYPPELPICHRKDNTQQHA